MMIGGGDSHDYDDDNDDDNDDDDNDDDADDVWQSSHSPRH